MRQSKKFIVVILAILLLVGGWYVKNNDISLFGGDDSLTVINYRTPFDANKMVVDNLQYRCLEQLGVETVPVNFRDPTKSVQFVVANGDESKFSDYNCLYTYDVLPKSSAWDTVPIGGPCSETISCQRYDTSGNVIDSACSNQGTKLNPDCPYLYFPSESPVHKTFIGKVIYDSEQKTYACRSYDLTLPILCFSNECGFDDFDLSNQRVCAVQSNLNSVLIYDVVFGDESLPDGVGVDSGSGSSGDSSEQPSVTEEGFFKSLWRKVKQWFSDLFR